MPNIQVPKTTHAHEELRGRLEVIASQAEEADRMIKYYEDMAKEQRAARDALAALHASYVGLLEDAGVRID